MSETGPSPDGGAGRIDRAEIDAAKGRLDRIVSDVCGACELNCCLEGTMAGTDDMHRIAKACRRSPEFKSRVISELRARALELRRDLEGMETTSRLLKARFAQDRAEDLGRLDDSLARWRAFCDFLDNDFEASSNDLVHCLMFSAIRAMALRAMTAFPGGANVLPALAGPCTSFQVGRRGVKPDRCIFHRETCMVAEAKPHKCADFYCSTEPGLIDRVTDQMTIDEFVLAHFESQTRPEILRLLDIELSMGPEHVASKVIVGGGGDFADGVAAQLRSAFAGVTEKCIEGGHLDVQVDIPPPTSDSCARPLVVHCATADAVGVYELSVMLVRARGETLHPVVVVVADEWRPCAGTEHPLWRERAISQPLSALALIAIVEE